MSIQSPESLPEGAEEKIADAIHNSQPFVDAVFAGLGPFSEINSAPWDDLSVGQKAVRKELAEADRSSMRLHSLKDVHSALVGSAERSGKYLRLRSCVTVIGLDSSRRRWLQTIPSKKAVSDLVSASEDKDVRKILGRPGSSIHKWSMIRSATVPNPSWVNRQLAVPEGGCLLGIYNGGNSILSKVAFKEAVVELAEQSPLKDFMFWDTERDGAPVLWSILGGFGCCGVEDVPWQADTSEAMSEIRAVLVS